MSKQAVKVIASIETAGKKDIQVAAYVEGEDDLEALTQDILEKARARLIRSRGDMMVTEFLGEGMERRVEKVTVPLKKDGSPVVWGVEGMSDMMFDSAGDKIRCKTELRGSLFFHGKSLGQVDIEVINKSSFYSWSTVFGD